MTSFDLVVLGLSLSSSWGNGHATTYRALLKAYVARGHRVLFLERQQPWYAAHRDLSAPDYCSLAFYDSLEDLQAWRDVIAAAPAVMVGSYVPEGIAVGRFVQDHARGVVAFYDIDTPVTLELLNGERCPYLTVDAIPDYDLYLSFSGGRTLDLLMERYGSPAARALYCSVDPDIYRPLSRTPTYDLGYLGTYSPDRQPTLEQLLIEPARRAPHLRFVVAGPQYPDCISWPANVTRLDHVAPIDHPAFYGDCRFTLNVTRADMIRAGHSPSVRLFEAAACRTPIISDMWDGLDTVLTPSREVVIAHGPGDVLAVLEKMGDAERLAMAEAARERVLSSHTAARRAEELEGHLRGVTPARARMAAPQVSTAFAV